MTAISYGTHYDRDRDLDITDIAKIVRKRIRQSSELAGIKCSVRISRYSMGQSLSVRIKEAPFLVVNPARIKADAENRMLEAHELPRHSSHVCDARRAIESIIADYNFGCSEPQTDYYHVNFHSNVDVDMSLERTHREWVKDLQSRGMTVKERK